MLLPVAFNSLLLVGLVTQTDLIAALYRLCLQPPPGRSGRRDSVRVDRPATAN